MTKSNVAIKASWLAATTVLSYVAGLIRDRLLAAQFGAGFELDVYNSAFLIPDTIMNIFAAALTTAFIPIFTSYRQQHGDAASWRVTNILLSCLSVVMVVVISLAYVVMPWIAQTVAPGFDGTARQLLIQTSRILLLSPFAFALSIALGAALQGTHRFFSYALSPVLYNAGIILGIVVLAPRLGIVGVTIGVVIGAVTHMMIRFIELRWSGWRWQWLLQWRDAAVHKTVRLMLPRVVSLLTVQANLWIYNALASTLMVGSIAVFNLARNFQSLPVSLFAIALATVIFPKLSEHFAKTRADQLVTLAEKALRQLLYFTLPAAAGMIVVAHALVDTLLGTGKFDDAAVQATGVTLAVFALSIPIESTQHILARVFYAQHDTITPVKISSVGLLVNTIVCILASRWFGVNGLVLGFIATTLSQVTLLAYALQRRGQQIIRRQTVYYIIQLLGLSSIMGLVAWLSLQLAHASWQQLLLAPTIGIICYGGLSYGLRIPEFHATVTMIKTLWYKIRGIIKSIVHSSSASS